MKPTTATIHLNLDHIAPGELPNFRSALIGGKPMLCSVMPDGLTVWLRVDQVNELASKLLIHLPSKPKEVRETA